MKQNDTELKKQIINAMRDEKGYIDLEHVRNIEKLIQQEKSSAFYRGYEKAMLDYSKLIVSKVKDRREGGQDE